MLDGQFTLGVEEEYQIVDPETRELKSYVSRLLEDGKSLLRERVRPEMHQSMVEVGTSVCPDVHAVKNELCEMRGELDRLARKGGLRIVAASTHPFSDWKTQDITDRERYHNIVNDLQDVARANLIFGLHIHVGVKDKEIAVDLQNQIRYFLPHLLALSTSSPFWLGRKTGLMSNRCNIFKRFPRTGIPEEFDNHGALVNYIQMLTRAKCIDSAKSIWWDVRAHHLYDTVEVRICDMPSNMEHTVAIVALTQALMAKLYLLRRRNQQWRSYSRAFLEENKWRALRYGSDARLIDFGMMEERPFKDLVPELVEFVRETAQIFGTERYLQTIMRIPETGTSAHRQLEVFEKNNGNAKAVVDHLIDETMKGI